MLILFKDDPLFEEIVLDLFTAGTKGLVGLSSYGGGFYWVYEWEHGDRRPGTRWSFGEEPFAADFRYSKIKHFLKQHYPEMLL